MWNAAVSLSDFLLVQIGDSAYRASLAETFEVPPSEVAAYYALWPWWATAGWGVAVFGATIGAILLLLRSRFAVHAFCAGLVGSIIVGVFQSYTPLPHAPGDQDMAEFMQLVPYIVAAEWVIDLVFILYARHLTVRQVLE